MKLQYDPNNYTDKTTVHRAYLYIYEILFERYKNTKNCILECGVDGSGSLVMWKMSFPKASKIIGIDINPIPAPIVGDDRIVHKQMNGYSMECVQSLKSDHFDIIIDDGSHSKTDMEFFCREYPKLLSDDGLLIVEDVQDIAWCPDFAKQLPDGFWHAVIDLRAINGRYDDVIMAIGHKQ